MTGEDRLTTDVLEQGRDSRSISGAPGNVIIALIIVVVALASGLAWWSHDSSGDRPSPSTRPLLASPLMGNDWSLNSDGTTMRLALSVTNADVHTMRIHEIRLAVAPGVTTEWAGLATDREMRHFSAEGFGPHQVGDGFELLPNESTHLVALIHVDCAELAASQTTAAPTFQIDYTASGIRRTQYLERSLASGPSPSPAEAWSCRSQPDPSD